MYEGWQFEKWETPVSHAKSLAMVSLIDDGRLAVILQDLRDARHRRHQFIFSNCVAYRNILEEYRMELWKRLDDSRQRCGWTLLVPNSKWVEELRLAEPVLEATHPALFHYLICTEDDVIEILTPSSPTIKEIESGTESESVGKSSVYYHPEDKRKINRVIRKE